MNTQAAHTVNDVKTQGDVAKLETEYPFEKVETFNSTYEAIADTAKRRADHSAMSFFLDGDHFDKARDISYRELLSNIHRTANFFDQLGLGSDDIVAFILPNLPETHYVIWGGQARCQILAINPLLEPDQIKELINAAGASAVVTMNPMINVDLWPKLEQVLAQLTSVKHVIGVDVAHYAHGVKGVIAKVIQMTKRRQIHVPKTMQYHNFTSAIKGQVDERLMFDRVITHETLSSLFCTGGTTGLPKIARRTHGNELANARAVQIANQSMLSEDKVMLAGLPLFHVNGALVTGLIPFMLGGKVVIATPQGYRGNGVITRFWDIVEHFRISAFSAVPTVYSALMNFPIGDRDISCLEAGICGAAPMPVETFKAFQEKTGVKIIEGYGLTEGTCVSSLNPYTGEQKIGSIGLRIPFQQMQCVKIEGDKISQVCEVDEIGALVIRGPNVFKGYQMEHQNKGLWLFDDEGNRWLNTGDLARQDSDGYFWLTGRKKELIVRGGHNIEPKLIEEAMCAHPDVNLAAAVGMPDAHAGEVPVCYVEIGAQSNVTQAQLAEFAAQHISERAAIPKVIHIVDALPLTAVGKVFKPELEMREIKACIEALAAKELAGVQVDVSVAQNSKHGVLASIKLTSCDPAQKQAFEKKLGQFTFKSVCE